MEPDTVASILHMSVLTKIPGGGYYYSHLTVEETEA